MASYVAITPAKDEERLMPGVIASMVAQSIQPGRWIIIDDGSTDATPQIVEEAALENPWIEVHHLAKDRPRAAGGESVIMQFLPARMWSEYDYILRLDADLTFESGMVERLIQEFDAAPNLGIAGATLLERNPEGIWQEARQPGFHTRGAVKLYRRGCFEAIDGLDAGLGWDTLDEIRAMMHGYTTHSFAHIQARHHRTQGTADGIVKGRLAAGRAAYRIGYSPLFMFARSLWRSLHPPFVLGGLALLAGYCEGYVRGLPKAVTPDVESFVRRQQRLRLLGKQSVWN